MYTIVSINEILVIVVYTIVCINETPGGSCVYNCLYK